MKNKPTPIAYPTTKEEEYRWGFDVFKPEGTPIAWIHDWKSNQAGWGVSPERVAKLLAFDIGTDLSQITADDVCATASSKIGSMFCGLWYLMAKKFGDDEVLKLGEMSGHHEGMGKWKTLQKYFGSPLPLDKIIWYQDITHTLSGPGMKPHSWTDGRKAVCCRSECATRPPKGLEAAGRLCRSLDASSVEGYMLAEPAMLACLAMDLGDNSQNPRCIHIWTYDREVISNLPADIKQNIKDSTKKMLRERGAKI